MKSLKWIPLLSAMVAQSQEPATLPRMVVTPGRGAAALSDVPQSVHLRDQEEIRMERMARTLPEALQDLPAVMVQKTGRGQGSPYLRGWTGFRTLLLIDGVRLNNSVFREGPNQYWATVDPLALSGLELTPGPGSVLYGSDAIGGTVQVFTPDPLRRHAQGERGGIHLRGASAENSGIGRVEAVGGAGNHAVQGGVSYKSYGDMRSGGGRLPETAYGEWSVDSKAAGWLPDDGRWSLLYQRHEVIEAPRTHRTLHAVPFRGTVAGTDRALDLDQQRQLLAGGLELPGFSGTWRDLRAGISWQRQEETQNRLRADGRRDLQSFQVDSHGVSLQASRGERQSVWTAGGDLGLDRVDSSGQNFAAGSTTGTPDIQGAVGDDSQYLTAGLFVQLRHRLNDRLELVAGLRGEHSAADVGRYENPATGQADSLKDDWQAAVGSGRVLYRMEEDWQIYGGIAQGFRAPNLSDLTSYGVARSGEVEVPSPGLDPEHFLNYELGVRRGGGGLKGEFTVWYTDVRDLIGRKPTGGEIMGEPSVTKTNASRGYVWGWEGRVSVDLSPSLELWGGVSWQEGSVDGYPDSSGQPVREPVSRLMPFTVMAGARQSLGGKSWIELSVIHAETADKLSSGDKRDTQRIPPGGTPGHTVAHLRCGRSLTDQTRISLGIENLLDKDYRIHGSGLNEPGRNFVAALEHRF